MTMENPESNIYNFPKQERNTSPDPEVLTDYKDKYGDRIYQFCSENSIQDRSDALLEEFAKTEFDGEMTDYRMSEYLARIELHESSEYADRYGDAVHSRCRDVGADDLFSAVLVSMYMDRHEGELSDREFAVHVDRAKKLDTADWPLTFGSQVDAVEQDDSEGGVEAAA